VQDNTKPILAFIAAELKKGEDIEIGVGNDFAGHFLTVTGISFDDTTNMGTISFIDPISRGEGGHRRPGEPAAGGARLTRDILGLRGGFIDTNYQINGRNVVIFAAVSESAVPEPSTITILLAGIGVLICISRRRAAG
jgi:hypothetical protein